MNWVLLQASHKWAGNMNVLLQASSGGIHEWYINLWEKRKMFLGEEEKYKCFITSILGESYKPLYGNRKYDCFITNIIEDEINMNVLLQVS